MGVQLYYILLAMLSPYMEKGRIEAGCDEAGRGCLAGPVVAAAVILPETFHNDELNDSKQLSEAQRNRLRTIIEKEALAYAVAFVMQDEIDRINILNASILGMQQAVSNLNIRPEFLLIDGNRFKPYDNIPHQCIVKGDAKFASIAAASVLAKTYRDEYMVNLAPQFPQYKWDENKGYPTKDHKEAVLKYGLTEHHRKSFHLKMQLSLDFGE